VSAVLLILFFCKNWYSKKIQKLEINNYKMNFTESVNKCLNHYFDFSGRASRSELWWFILFQWAGGIVAGIFDSAFLDHSFLSEDLGPLSIIWQLGTGIPTLAVGARRLHDINKSGWWQLLIATLIGIILLVVWFATDGDKKNNRFGKPIKFKRK
tara:strand:- start:1013 stop:1477 length:465 start_codon:yes stop_codon:yes gene_type:complete